MSEGDNTPDVGALQAKLNEQETRAKRFEGMVKDLEVKLESFRGIDPQEVKALKEELDIVKRERAEKSPDDLKKWQSEKEQEIRRGIQKDLDEMKAALGKVRGENHELKVVEKAVEQIGAKFNDDTLPFIKQYIRQSVDREGEDFIIKDETGNVRYSRSNPAAKMSIAEFAEEIASKHPSMARPETRGGTGTGGTKSSGTGAISVDRYMKMTPEQRAKEIPDARERGKLAQQALSSMKFSSI
jgi:hypothetical protein